MFNLLLLIMVLMFTITASHKGAHYAMGGFYVIHPNLVEVSLEPAIFKKGILKLHLIPVTDKVNQPSRQRDRGIAI